jgi:hypothetical protein
MREQKSERRRSINVSKNGAGQAVSMRGGQERNVANESVEIGFVGLGPHGNDNGRQSSSGWFQSPLLRRRLERALTSQVAIAAGVAERRPRTGTS